MLEARRLALGTVQFGQHYGVANASGQVGLAAIRAILARAREAGIDTLDTAIAYGNSESRLGEAGVSSWRLITKLPGLPSDESRVSEWVHAQVEGSLDRLGIKQLDALLVHHPSDVLGTAGCEYRDALATLKASHRIHAAGISIYDPAELDAVCASWQPDIVQAPCNVLDRRLVRSGWLAKLSDRGVRVHIRSVFLQGVLLMPAQLRPAWFSRWTSLLDSWLEWCRCHQTTPLHAALRFALGQSGVERVVIGVDSDDQLQQILEGLEGDAAPVPHELWSDDRDLIEPTHWRLT